MSNMITEYADDCFSEIIKKKYVDNIVIANDETSAPLVSTMHQNTSIQYAKLFGDLLADARFGFRNIDQLEEVEQIRLKTAKDEIVITPDEGILIIVRQSPPPK